MKLDVITLAGKKAGTVDVADEVFGLDPRSDILQRMVRWQLAKRQAGTHKTKDRSEVRASTAKIHRQKGTGRSRQGSIRAPQWVGGGVAHGRTPKDWSVRVNKKLKRTALRSALTDRANHDAVVIVRDLAFGTPRTKDAVAALDAVGATGRALVVLADWDQPTARSFRNLSHVHTLVVDQLNTHDVVNADVVVFDEAALELIGTGKRASTATTSDDTAGGDSEEVA